MTEDARFSAGMFAAQAAGTLVNQGDRMLVAALGSPAMAGLYALCINIANKTVAAVVAITSFVFPHVAGLQSSVSRTRRSGLCTRWIAPSPPCSFPCWCRDCCWQVRSCGCGWATSPHRNWR